jgi:hypothetical protein
MYRPGIGDCFLLAFRAADGDDRARYMLIDCGVLVGTTGGADRMRDIAKDIAEATGGRLHVLVATHEHWDHLSGFQYANETFADVTIDDVWLAWTEDPEDELAKRLRQKRALALKGVLAAVAQLERADEKGARAMAGAISGVLDFHREFGIEGRINTTAEQLEYVQSRGSPPRYRRPGEPPIVLPGVEGVRVYVLGPPKNESLLSKSDPSKADSEVYERALALSEANAFYLAALAAGDREALLADEGELWERSHPFHGPVPIAMDQAEKHDAHGDFFRVRYFGLGENGEDIGWRRIDTDWLGAAGQLALDLDNDTNNTCLALAIELTESGKVLIFPADAQVGNWLSWHDVSWPGECDNEDDALTGSDLIRRTVLYKVGHHGSHNATLREKGLEMMESPDLVAMIPVDGEKAEDKEWAMPFPPLLTRLEEKTKGRIIRADTGLPAERPERLSPSEWESFRANVEKDPSGLWIQYTVTG